MGTKVEIVNKPIKTVYYKNTIWVESHLEEKTDNNSFPIQKIDGMISHIRGKYQLTEVQMQMLMDILNDNTGLLHPLNS